MPENPHSVELVENEGTTDLSEYGLEDDSEVVPPPQLPSFNCNELKIVDSNEIHVGHRTYYTGSVTIKQIVVPETGNGDVRIENIQASNAKSNTQLVPQLQQEDAKKPSKLIPLKKSPYLMGGLFIVLLVLICLIIYLTVPSSSNSDEDGGLPMNFSMRFVKRGDWYAVPSTGEILPLHQNPVHFVMIAHTAGIACDTRASCSNIVRSIQSDHISRDFGDIGYNFLVGGDGYIYEGLGWGKKGSHTLPFNGYSIGVAFMGNYMFKLPQKKQLDAFELLLKNGVSNTKLISNYTILFQKQVIATESPGAVFIEEIKKWPHWKSCDEDFECDTILKKYYNRQVS